MKHYSSFPLAAQENLVGPIKRKFFCVHRIVGLGFDSNKTVGFLQLYAGFHLVGPMRWKFFCVHRIWGWDLIQIKLLGSCNYTWFFSTITEFGNGITVERGNFLSFIRF